MLPVQLTNIPPCASLQDYVRKYQVFRFVFDKHVIPPVKFHAPRPEHSITFYVRDVQTFSEYNSGTILPYPRCVINGMYTVPIYRYGGNDFWAIKVVLQPSTLFHLTKTTLAGLTNHFLDAEEVWGNEIDMICDQLNTLEDLNEMISVIEAFLENQVNKISKPYHVIDKVSHYILDHENKASLDWLASQSCLSTRQFSRIFEERIGVSAKTFKRIVRFDKAYRAKNSQPDSDWLFIAVDCDFYDYQHLVKDFKEFTKLTPPAFYEIEKRSPERSFGLFEA
jgi:AraC-like DNA-binding protein